MCVEDGYASKEAKLIVCYVILFDANHLSESSTIDKSFLQNVIYFLVPVCRNPPSGLEKGETTGIWQGKGFYSK